VHDGTTDFSSDGLPFSLTKGEMVVTIPVTADEGLLGVLAMTFANESLFEDQDIAVLQVGMNSLAVSMNSAKQRDSYEKSALLMDTHSRLLKIAVGTGSLSELLVTGKEQFKSFVPYDMLSISVVDDNAAAMKRYSVMASGNKVSERGLSLPVHETVVERVVRTRSGDISNNITGIVHRDDAWLSKCGFSSRLSVPVFIEDRVVGVASFASMALAGFSESMMSKAELLAEIFSVVISNSLIRDRLKGRDRQMQTSWRLLSRLASTGNIEEFFDEFAKQMTSGMPVTSCRLSSFNRDADRLRVVTEHSLRESTEPEGRPDAETPIDQMPRHRSVLESGKALVVNQADEKDRMTDEEIERCFPSRIRSAMIVPLNVGGTVRGVMSLGEARDPSRRTFDSGDLSFAQMQATQASLALAILDNNARLNSLRSADQNGAAVLETLSDLSRRMAGPLSSIIGAAELLERNLPDTGSQMMRCIGTIRRNTNNVVKIVDDFKQFRDAVS
jgi:transcriptional regulator with GAF, ATPase, and Fis domain